jgi:hypothetical protein
MTDQVTLQVVLFGNGMKVQLKTVLPIVVNGHKHGTQTLATVNHSDALMEQANADGN